jgi:hypothetical protein
MLSSLTRKLLLLPALLSFIFSVAQEDKTSNRHYPSVMLGVGATKFTGDVGQHNDANPLDDARGVMYLKAEYRFGKYFGLMAGGLYGKLAGTDNSLQSHRNFQSSLLQFELNAVTYFDHLFKQNDEVSPFLGVGAGYLMFDPYGNLKNASGQRYNYWSDGSVRDLDEASANAATAVVIKKDQSYESQLTDSANAYTRACITVPVLAGLDWQLGKLHRWDVQLGVNYNFLLSDFVDNYKSGGNDSYWMAHIGIKYTFAPRPKTASDDVNFSEVDRLDVDGDGVPDDKDDCLSTPKGVAVDKNGCPPDMDKDGVADYMDKEPNSKKGATVNEYGVTLNLDSIAYHQVMWDSLASERKEGFEQNPSLNQLQKTDEEAVKKGDWDYNKVPDRFKVADANKDGYITSKEVYKALDEYFEGTNSMTAEDIEELINYFFEQ